MKENRGWKVPLKLSTFELNYSVMCLSRLAEKSASLEKVVYELDKIMNEQRGNLVTGLIWKTAGDLLIELKSVLDNLLKVKWEYCILERDCQVTKESAELITSQGIQVVKLIGEMNTLFTKVQLLIKTGSFSYLNNEKMLTVQYLIDYGRTQLFEIVR